MGIKQSFRLAIQNIWFSKIRAVLTMLGIIIGVAAVIVIVGLGNGMEKYMTDSFASLGTNTLTVMVTGRGSSRSISEEEIYTLVEENPTLLAHVSPTVSLNNTIKIGNETLSATTTTGVGEAYADMRGLEMSGGRFLQYMDVENRSKVCVIGSYIDREFYNGDSIGQTIKIGGNTYTVVGVLTETADSEEGDGDDCIYIPYSVAAKMSWTGTINSYLFTVPDENNIAASQRLIESTLYKVFQSDSAYNIINMSEMLETMTSMVDMLVLVLAGIAGISLVVGGIGIMNIMLVSVTERTREIGIRKALGAKQKHILQQFVIEAATTSALGGILGILTGFAFSAIATQVIARVSETDISVSPSMGAVALAFGISAAIGIIFGYLPAKKAAKLNPIDALRYD